MALPYVTSSQLENLKQMLEKEIAESGGGGSSSQYKVTLTCPGWTQYFDGPEAEDPTYEWFPAIKLEIITSKSALDEVFEEVYHYTTDIQPILQAQGEEYPILHFQSFTDLINWYDSFKSDAIDTETSEGFFNVTIFNHIISTLAYKSTNTIYKQYFYEYIYDTEDYPVRDSEDNIVWDIVSNKFIFNRANTSKYYISDNPETSILWQDIDQAPIWFSGNPQPKFLQIALDKFDDNEPNWLLSITGTNDAIAIGFLVDSTLTITKA